MQMVKAAALIHSRTAYCDFRSKFLAHPQCLAPSTINEINALVLQTTQLVEGLLDYSAMRQIVYSNSEYILFGLTAYIKDIYAHFGVSNNSLIFTDEHKRPIYLSVGLLFKKQEIKNTVKFPSVDHFIYAIEKYVVPRWQEKEYDDNADQATLTGFDIEVKLEEPRSLYACNLNLSHTDKVKLFPLKESSELITTSITEAINGKSLACCTNFESQTDAENSFFLNVTCKGVESAFLCGNRRSISKQIEKENYSNDFKRNPNYGKNRSREAPKETHENRHGNKNKEVAIVFNLPDWGIIERIKGFLDKFGIKYNIVTNDRYAESYDSQPTKSKQDLLFEHLKQNASQADPDGNLNYQGKDIFDLDK